MSCLKKFANFDIYSKSLNLAKKGYLKRDIMLSFNMCRRLFESFHIELRHVIYSFDFFSFKVVFVSFLLERIIVPTFKKTENFCAECGFFSPNKLRRFN